MEATYPPFVFMDKNNQIEGFEVELAKNLCQEMKRECSFGHQAFDSLIVNLNFNRFDAIISSMDITDARAKQVAFSQPYYRNSATFVALRGTVSGVSELTGQRVGVQNGSTHQKYLLEQKKGMKVVAYDSYQSGLLDLKNSRIQALFTDLAVAKEWMNRDPAIVTIGAPVDNVQYFGRGLAIAVRKKDKLLLVQLNEALQKLEKDGRLNNLKSEWFK